MVIFSQGKNALTGCWFFCFVRNLNALRARASWQNDSVFWFFRIIFQSKNALFTFLFSVNFTIFVAVVKGDIQKKWIFISKKVYPGITAATKSCFQKMEKSEIRSKNSQKMLEFSLKMIISRFFLRSDYFKSACIHMGGCRQTPPYFRFLFVLFFHQLPS